MHKPRKERDYPQDPTLEEIWGTDTVVGMAEAIRMMRPTMVSKPVSPAREDGAYRMHLPSMMD